MEQKTFTTLDIRELKSLITDSLKETIIGLDFLKPQEPSNSKQILTRKETAEMLAVSLPTLHTYTKEGKIKSFRLGHLVRYRLEDVYKSLTLINVGGKK
jgi:excisionase family DNA binding protein